MIRLPRLCSQRSWATVVFAVACALAAACGGSGSSGFDILESQAITRVTEDQQCEEFEGLLICPADTAPAAPSSPTPPPDPTPSQPADTATATPTEQPMPAPTDTPVQATTATAGPNATPSPPEFGTPTVTIAPVTATATRVASATRPQATATRTPPPTSTPSPTMIPSPGIITAPGESSDSLDCVTQGESGCALRFSFSPVGFPFETAFRTASRRVGVTTPWSIDNPAPVGNAGAPFEYVTLIAVDLSAPAAGSPAEEMLQVVVLGFERDPGPVPSQVNSLSETGADIAFAVAPFPITLR